MLDYDDSRAVFDQAAQHAGQHAHVERVQPYRRFVEDEDRVVLRTPHLGRELEPLRLAARERRRRLAERQVAEAELGESAELFARALDAGEFFARLVDGQSHELRQRNFPAAEVQRHAARGLRVAPAAARRADYLNVWKELHVHSYLPRAVAVRTAQRTRVV